MNLESLRLIDQAIDATGGVWTSNASRCRVQKTIITRAEFEARKAERQNKPNWPCGYSQIIQNAWGEWFGSKSKQPWHPCVKDWSLWAPLGVKGEVIGQWADTWEQRPNQIHPTGDLGRSTGTVGANHIGESDEKVREAADFVRKLAVIKPGYAVWFARQALPELFDNAPKPDDASDWYDYENQTVIKLPPVGAKFELYPFFHPCEVVAHHDGGAVVYDKKALEYVHIKWGNFRCSPLDFNRKPEPSPELSFHLSNAFNELQASARLLSEDDPRRAQIVALAGGVSAVKEVA